MIIIEPGDRPRWPRGLLPGFSCLSLKKKGKKDEDESWLAISFFPLVAGAFSGFFPDLRRGQADFRAVQRLRECPVRLSACYSPLKP